MKNFKLKIADYKLGFEATSKGSDIIVSPKFKKYISADTSEDICIRIHSGYVDLPAGAELVFDAPLVEEINGILISNNPEFWSIWKYDSHLFIKTALPLSSRQKSAVLKFSLKEKEWDLWIGTDENEIDPLEFPLDGLILYYLTAINNDIMIHASGVNYEGKGLLFSGVSGKGKSTMAGLWNNHNARIIHDDRLIIRKSGSGYFMFNTPVYNSDEPLYSPLERIFIIEHGNENKLTALKEATAVGQVLANCIQHSWGAEIISKLLGSVSEMCTFIPVCKLYFKPDTSVIDYILLKR